MVRFRVGRIPGNVTPPEPGEGFSVPAVHGPMEQVRIIGQRISCIYCICCRALSFRFSIRTEHVPLKQLPQFLRPIPEIVLGDPVPGQGDIFARRSGHVYLDALTVVHDVVPIGVIAEAGGTEEDVNPIPARAGFRVAVHQPDHLCCLFIGFPIRQAVIQIDGADPVEDADPDAVKALGPSCCPERHEAVPVVALRPQPCDRLIGNLRLLSVSFFIPPAAEPAFLLYCLR